MCRVPNPVLRSELCHLSSLTYHLPFERQRQDFPFNLPVLQGLETLEFTTPVTFFVGENGSGKSTLLEALACAAGLPAVGSERLEQDPSLAHARLLGNHFRLAWKKRTHRGFFLRAEDFFGYARRMAQIRAELHATWKTWTKSIAAAQQPMTWPRSLITGNWVTFSSVTVLVWTLPRTARLSWPCSKTVSSQMGCICWTNQKPRSLLYASWR